MKIRYVVADPTKNITVLVLTPLPRELYPAVSRILLSSEKTAEQVAFIEFDKLKNSYHMEMMGGEFCGNATMSFGSWLSQRKGIDWGSSMNFSLDVSGTSSPVPCQITSVNYGFIGTVAMPLPASVEEIELPYQDDQIRVTIVHMGGIDHIIVADHAISKSGAESLLKQWASILKSDALGLLFLDESTMSFVPLVYVHGTDTSVWENGCGSGSAAIAAYLTKKHSQGLSVSLKQPGGTIAVTTGVENGVLTCLTITGTVSLGMEKTINIKEDQLIQK